MHCKEIHCRITLEYCKTAFHCYFTVHLLLFIFGLKCLIVEWQFLVVILQNMAAGYRLFIKFPKFREAEKQENKNLIIIIYYRSSVICTADFVILEHFYLKKTREWRVSMFLDILVVCCFCVFIESHEKHYKMKCFIIIIISI